MKYRRIECEVITSISGQRDCAHHQQLGWSRTEWHRHNRGQLIYAENGIMRLYVGFDVFYIPSFHAAWIPEGVEHAVITESVDLTFRTLYLKHNGLTDPFYNRVAVFHTPQLLCDMISFTARWPMKEKPVAEEQVFLHAIKVILPQFAKNEISIQIPASEDKRLNNIFEQIATELESLPPAGAIARYHGMSERTMNRLFVKEIKMPFSQYVKLLRIITAVEMLTKPGAGVSETALAVGYRSLSSFSNTFYEVLGKRPQYFLYKKSGVF